MLGIMLAERTKNSQFLPSAGLGVIRAASSIPDEMPVSSGSALASRRAGRAGLALAHGTALAIWTTSARRRALLGVSASCSVGRVNIVHRRVHLMIPVVW
jgi:hypothetical protein